MVCMSRASAGNGVAGLELEDVARDELGGVDHRAPCRRGARARSALSCFFSASSAASARRSW